MRNGTVKHSTKIDFSQDIMWKDRQVEPGFYVYFGTWKGPFASQDSARAAYREWAWELRHS